MLKRKPPSAGCKYLGQKGNVFLKKFCSKHKRQIITKVRKNSSKDDTRKSAWQWLDSFVRLFGF